MFRGDICERLFKFPTSHIKYKGKKSAYFEVISSLEFEQCNYALKRITERVDLNKINCLIESVEGISQVRKQFYKIILKERYEKILLDSYMMLKKKEGEA